MKKKLLVLILGVAMIFAFAACGSDDGGEEPDTGVDMTQILADPEAKTVTIYATVNGKYFDESTMHYVVNKDGGAGKKAMLQTEADSQAFYDAMVEIGGDPWNKTDARLESGEFTDGEVVDITLTWDGQDEPVNYADTVKTGSGDAFKADMRFSGNQQGNADAGSGCISCLNSCWAGITSNAAYGFDAIDNGEPEVFLNSDVMPEDGTVVAVTFTLK